VSIGEEDKRKRPEQRTRNTKVHAEFKFSEGQGCMDIVHNINNNIFNNYNINALIFKM
jgi:hypothetical protein